MILQLYDRGDRSVGIEPYGMKVEIEDCWVKDANKEERQYVREQAIKFFEAVYDGEVCGTVEAVFEDECWECGYKLVGGKCMFKECPEYQK